MRLLILSLIFVTLSAAFSMGWLLDNYYDKAYPIDPAEEHQQLISLANAYIALNNSLPQSPLAHNDIPQLLTVSHTAFEDFPLPQELLPSFTAGEPLLLSAEGLFSLHLYSRVNQRVYSFDFSESEHLIDKHQRRLLLTLLFYAGILFLVALWLLPLIQRILLIRKSLRLFGRGDLLQRIPHTKFSYLGDIEFGFNQMAARIESLIEDNRLLSRAVSHDLRTPIARLRFGVDMLFESAVSDTHIRHLEHLNRDLDEMESLVETLLSFAKLDKSTIELALDHYELFENINELITPYSSAKLKVDISALTGAPSIKVDKTYFNMLMNNLIGNAVQHAKTHIRITYTVNTNTLVLMVEDDGEGIPEASRSKVFLPFYRESNLNNGHGMGLAIVAKIAQWHRIDIQLVQSEQLGGLGTHLSIPR